jgi:GAF domain-containing protein
LQLACEYAQYYWALDPVSATGWTNVPNRAVGVMNLHRLRDDRDFSDRDVAFVHALLPQVSRALHFLEERNQRPGPTGIFILSDTGTVVRSRLAARGLTRRQQEIASRVL